MSIPTSLREVTATPQGPTSRWQAWLMATRPATLTASTTPVLVGTAAAASKGSSRLDIMIAALLASLWIQIGTDLANDLFDGLRGADSPLRLGPTRVTQTGLLTPRQVATAAVLSFGLAFAIGLYLTAIGGWPIMVIGLAGITAGVLYTGGPWPLGYHGLGDLLVFFFFGVVAVVGTYYLHMGKVDGFSLLVSMPVGLTATAILAIDHLRDIEADLAVGKHTLAAQLGDRRARWYITTLLAMAYLLLGVSLAVGQAGTVGWLPLLSLPFATGIVRSVLGGTQGAALTIVLQRMGRLHLLLGLLTCFSFWSGL